MWFCFNQAYLRDIQYYQFVNRLVYFLFNKSQWEDLFELKNLLHLGYCLATNRVSCVDFEIK